MASTIREHAKLFNELKDKRKADLLLTSTEEIYWICSICNLKSWKCPVNLRNKYPDVIRCCRRRIKNSIGCKDCDTRATFNYPEFNWVLYCVTHCLNQMVSINPFKPCIKCDKKAEFGDEPRKRIYC